MPGRLRRRWPFDDGNDGMRCRGTAGAGSPRERRPASGNHGIASDRSATGHQRTGGSDCNRRASGHVRFNGGPGHRYADGNCRRHCAPTSCGPSGCHVATGGCHRGSDGGCAYGYAGSDCRNCPSAHRGAGR
ncbi:MAG: hypothetical protein OXL37_15160 [Chloroflexota bacterium]|nr:hypothetical protein [Chloroflexota bacterium]